MPDVQTAWSLFEAAAREAAGVRIERGWRGSRTG
jgi:hypothetical protein